MTAAIDFVRADWSTWRPYVRVTQQDIDDGRRRLAKKCPLALSLTRNTGRWPRPVVLGGRSPSGARSGAVVFESESGETVLTLILPPDACKFMTDFDEGKKVEPFEFSF